VVINFGEEEMYRAFGELLQTVRTGESARRRLRRSAVRVLRREPTGRGERGGTHGARTVPVASQFSAYEVLRFPSA